MTTQPSHPPDGSAKHDEQPISVPEAPQNILNAVKLMYVGAAISAIGFLYSLTGFGDFKADLAETNPDFTETQINAVYALVIGLTVAVAGIAAGLWIWMARMNKKGRSWARTVAAVLGALYVVFLLSRGLSVNHDGVAVTLNLLALVVAAATLWLLYRPDSSAYYQAISQSRAKG